MNERLKLIRKTLKMTQKDFGERVGIKGNTIAQYEIGRNEPPQAIINSLCKEYQINENWLRTGEGKMFIRPSAFSLDELARQRQASQIEIRVIKTYFELPKETRELLIKRFGEALREAEDDPALLSDRVSAAEADYEKAFGIQYGYDRRS